MKLYTHVKKANKFRNFFDTYMMQGMERVSDATFRIFCI